MTKSRPRLIILTKALRTRSKNGRLKDECHFCHGSFTINELIVTKKAGNYASWFHELCAKRINLI